MEDATAVAREFVRRAWHNATLVHGRLQELGFAFREPGSALTPAPLESVAAIADIEKEVGLLPLSLRAWYEVFGSLDFSQDPKQCYSGDHPLRGMGFSFALIVKGAAWALEDWRSRQRAFQNPSQSLIDFWDSVGGKPSQPFKSIFTGSVNTACEKCEIPLPDPRADAFPDRETPDISFVASVRRSFRWGGFGYFRLFVEDYTVPAIFPRPDVEQLLPILTEGLLPL